MLSFKEFICYSLTIFNKKKLVVIEGAGYRIKGVANGETGKIVPIVVQLISIIWG
jgi:hypothetical protein